MMNVLFKPFLGTLFLYACLASSFFSFCLPQAFAEMPKEREVSLKHLADQVDNMSKTIAEQQKRIEKLEAENAELERKVNGKETEILEPSKVVSSKASPTSLNKSAFNPEIGVVADVTAVFTESGDDLEGNDKLSVRELEIIFGHDIDPFARFDSTLTFSDFEDPTIEEAYFSLFNLPLELKGKLGRIRPKIGKANAIHRDQLETVDEPFVVQEYLGIEGLYRTGAEISYFTPLPFDAFVQEITLGVMEGGIGEEGTLLGETRRHPTFHSHLKNFWEFSDTDSVELGFSLLRGSSDDDSRYEVSALGLDATYLKQLSSSRRLKLQSEFYFQDRSEGALLSDDGHRDDDASAKLGEEEGALESPHFRDNPLGGYVLVDYRFNPRLSFGSRFDYVESVNLLDADSSKTLGASAYFTYYQSELKYRLQYQYADLDKSDDNRVFLQATGAIGVHKHQLQ